MDKERIILEAHPLIVASIRKYAIGKGEFEDLYQEGVVKLLELLQEFDEEKGVGLFYYLKLHLKFFYLNYGRYEREHISLDIPIGDGIELGDTLEDNGEPTEEIVLKQLDIESLYRALEELKDEERYIIEQLIIKRKTLDTVAKELSISRTTLFRRRNAVLKKLKEKLEKE